MSRIQQQTDNLRVELAAIKEASHVKDRHISRILNGMIVHNDNWRMRQACLSRRMNRAEEASKEISNRQEHIEKLGDATKEGFSKIAEASMLNRKGYSPVKSEYSATNLLKAINRSELMEKERRSHRVGDDLDPEFKMRIKVERDGLACVFKIDYSTTFSDLVFIVSSYFDTSPVGAMFVNDIWM